MTLTTTEELKHLASSDNANELTRRLARECLANREAQPVYQYRMRNPYNGQVTDWETTKPEQVDFILKETIAANVEFRIIAAPPAPAVPDALEKMRSIVADPRALPRRKEWISGQQYSYVLLENVEAMVDEACRAAMLAQPVSGGYTLPDGWIACSERMPEPNKYVQVSNGVWVGIGMYNDADHFEDDERWQDEHHEFIDLLHHPVTHWMPLPAAPEGGGNSITGGIH